MFLSSNMLEDVMYEKRRVVQPGEGKAREMLLSTATKMEGAEKAEPDLSAACSAGSRGNRHRLEHQKLSYEV